MFVENHPSFAALPAAAKDEAAMRKRCFEMGSDHTTVPTGQVQDGLNRVGTVRANLTFSGGDSVAIA